MLKTDKERIVDELAADLGSAETLIVADYRGLDEQAARGAAAISCCRTARAFGSSRTR